MSRMSRARTSAERILRVVRRGLIRRSIQLAAAAPPAVADRLDLPADVSPFVPSESQLRRWAVAVGVDYQAWCMHHGLLTLAEWQQQRRDSLKDEWNLPPQYSILTPVHDTPPAFLREAVYSVLAQSHPYWELCLVDDASTDPTTIAELDRLASSDGRIRLRRLTENVGICAATNEALAMATAPYVAFLDHDDRLAPDALYEVEQRTAAEPGLQIVYSDRDLLDAGNFRAAPTFKPGWAPETLLGGNYMFHLMVYRRDLITDLGGYRAEYEGSQDLDLALRAAERRPWAFHVPKVLYHWRSHEGSMAGLPEAKPHIFAAGIAAVEDALERRGIEATVEEIPDIWRGHYRVRLAHSTASREVVRVDDPAQYRRQVAAALESTTAEHLVVLGPGVEPDDGDATIAELCAWLTIDGVVATTGLVLDPADRIRHAGLVRNPRGVPLSTWTGYPITDPGYMAMNVSIRNVSLVHPLVCAWRTDVLRAVGGVDGPATYESAFAMVDAAVRADIEQHRFVYDPLARFHCDDPGFAPEAWSAPEAEAFAAHRAELLTIDGHFNLNFDRNQVDCRIGLAAPDYATDW